METDRRNDSVELRSIGASTQNDQHNAATPAADDTTSILQASNIVDAQVPEGGYGWVVITGCAIMTFWFVGTSYSWGVVQAALVEHGLGSASTLSFVGSLTTTCISVFAVSNARIIRKIGARYTGLVGIFLLGGGELLSSFSTHNIGALFVTTGMVTGIGTR